MTFKTTLLSTAAVLAMATPSLAQSADVTTTTGAGSDLSVSGAGIDAGSNAEVNAEAGVQGDTELGTDEFAADVDAGAGVDTELDGDAVALRGMTVAEVVGMDVHTATDTDVGEVDYVVEAEGGYEAIIGVGGFLGIGESTVAVPLDALIVAEGDSRLILEGYTEADIEAMPEVSEADLDALPSDFVIS
ncbi:PRC-barrel domain-containing protein [Gymnodinialimonas ceratoperidinii]|uniref:PRC-barrel domain-containing protein n=1 Tax=Gymnodinialimonas ceratoperidinii TaxID=2856823 RepID=A0A8F6TWC8_9RHOB|nr:PRC-barrel domain-containing protein [Gymnodinialimonas ceratoperidinii]QXT40152.1 PRC-barrel domain-containing protein [Gymnodinialimonas ceratoperidinii]